MNLKINDFVIVGKDGDYIVETYGNRKSRNDGSPNYCLLHKNYFARFHHCLLFILNHDISNNNKNDIKDILKQIKEFAISIEKMEEKIRSEIKQIQS